MVIKIDMRYNKIDDATVKTTVSKEFVLNQDDQLIAITEERIKDLKGFQFDISNFAGATELTVKVWGAVQASPDDWVDGGANAHYKQMGPEGVYTVGTDPDLVQINEVNSNYAVVITLSPDSTQTVDVEVYGRVEFWSD